MSTPEERQAAYIAHDHNVAWNALWDRCEKAEAENARLRDDRWKHGAESMRQTILQQLPGGQTCDPQWVADMIRAIEVPSQDQQHGDKRE